VRGAGSFAEYSVAQVSIRSASLAGQGILIGGQYHKKITERRYSLAMAFLNVP
jgi:hypothetical protein